MDKIVEIRELNFQLQKVINRVENPNHGIFGPNSLIWKINRERINLMGGGRALLLQLAHPWVSAGVEQHSKVKTDLIGRYRRTFHNIRGMVFGDLKTALKCAKAVYEVHKKVKGRSGENTEYFANNEKVLMWVHSTLWDTSVKMYELFIRKLSDEELEHYYQDTKFFAYLFGISDETLPENWKAFTRYTKCMCNGDTNELKINNNTMALAEHIFNPSILLKLPGKFYKSFTTHILPESVRKLYKLEYGLKQKFIYESIYQTLKPAYRLLPKRLRYVPEYGQALKRIENG
jgi:uncharacterized protein (DUF2236 family)